MTHAHTPPAPIADAHTMALLSRLDLQIRREVLRLRNTVGARQDEDYRGLYISDDDVEAMLDPERPPITPLELQPLPEEVLEPLETGIGALSARIEALEAEDPSGAGFRLMRLARLFGLSRLERDVLLVCLAAELDLKYERLFAYLQDDVSRKRPSIDLLLKLLCPELEDRLQARQVFEPQAPLLRWELVSLLEDPNARRPVLPARHVRLDERIAAWLLGSDAPDTRLLPLIRQARLGMVEGADDEWALLPPEVCARLDAWSAAWSASRFQVEPIVLAHGRPGTGRRALAAYLARRLGRPLLLLSIAEHVLTELRPAQVARLAEREARLNDALLCWVDTNALLEPGGRDGELELRAFLAALNEGNALTLLVTERAWEASRAMPARPLLRLEVPAPAYPERVACWRRMLDGQEEEALDLPGLASRFQLTPGQIRDAAHRARNAAWARDPASGRLSAADLEAACRGVAQHRLSSLAQKILPVYGWDDIVLPRQQLMALRLIASTLRHRPRVYGEWGFERKLARGRGVLSLFAGPSGTGKTMSAEIIARDLGLDLYRIDLSSVVSKYIGETEKNLERIFSEAQESDAILFFDEADALFGKRSEVKDAHDRYANLETAYLLQRTEEYSGLVILATNLKKNMDDAFVRRLQFIVDFPMPEEPERLEIWRRILPAEAPRTEDIELEFLARRLKLAGGNIKNIAVAGAFLAAEEGQAIGMRHLIRAAAYEYQKMGKLVTATEFDRYLEWVR